MYILTRGRMKFEVYDRIYFENMLCNKFLRAEIYLCKYIIWYDMWYDIISLERKIKCEEHFDIIDEGVLVYYIYIKNVLLLYNTYEVIYFNNEY